METFDRKGISFVSVTQSFNTTNSMGKLTLNILLSFAQFEREVTGERIRDKIPASKKKGMWMSGIVPLGYDVIEKKLLPNPEEAKTINYIFESYLQVKSIAKWTNSMLGRVLRNPVYIGKIHHKGNVYDGEHEAVISEELFNEVQELLNNQNRRNNDNLEVGKYLSFKNCIMKMERCLNAMLA